MRVWRALKALGCGVLRDGVYLLPNRPGFRQALEEQAGEVVQGGGNAHVLVLDSESQDQQQAFESLFDRSDDYARLVGAVRQTVAEIPSEEPAKLGRKVNRLRRELEAIVALDYFPGADTVSVIDTGRDEVVKTIPVPKAPEGIAVRR
jgi:YVTN family beta-propeller protein